MTHHERGTADCTVSAALASAQRTVRIEQAALSALAVALDDAVLAVPFAAVTQLIAESRGRVIVTGIGKSGIVSRKLAATLASTGTPALFMHPSEASHGDLGMVRQDDIVIAVSWSGETSELTDTVTYCRRFSVPLVAITAQANSTLAKQANVALVLPEVEEACPNRLAPTSSTIVQAALSDALAVALIEQRGFSPDDFRLFHPRGKLGAQLLRVCDVMKSGADIPVLPKTASVLDAVLEMTRARLGVTAIVEGDDVLIGALTDGDLRRVIAVAAIDAPVIDHMTCGPVRVVEATLASEALALMNKRKISQLFVCVGDKLVGVVHLHDLLAAGVV